ncbi:MAG: hypothetical protein C1943_16460 [Halochromatium sp.]|nr:hypothetical protein [Halochromatium sp.]
MRRSSPTDVHPPGPLRAWITVFKHWQEELTMATIAHEPVQQAMNRIRQLSTDWIARPDPVPLGIEQEHAISSELGRF